MKPFYVPVLLTAAVMSSVFAEEAAQTRPETVFSAGFGALIVDKPHRGGDTDVRAIPMVFYRNGRFVWSGTRVSYYLVYDQGWAVSLLGTPRFEGYDDDESSYLNGMHDRDATYEAGLQAAKTFDWGTLTATVLTDVLGEHGGQEIRLTYEKKLEDVLAVEKFDLTPQFGINWRSKQLNDYYYGVEGTEATPGRPEYHAGSTTGILAGVRFDYALSEKWNLFSAVNVEWLGSEITDSPIVNENAIVTCLFGAMYRF